MPQDYWLNGFNFNLEGREGNERRDAGDLPHARAGARRVQEDGGDAVADSHADDVKGRPHSAPTIITLYNFMNAKTKTSCYLYRAFYYSSSRGQPRK